MKKYTKNIIGTIILIIILGMIIFFAAKVKKQSIKSDSNATYVKAVVTEVVQDSSGYTEYGGHQKVRVKLNSGQYKGQECEVSNPNSYQRGAYCVKGTRLIVMLTINKDGSLTGSVFNYDRSFFVWLLVAIFCISILAVGGKKGARSLIALVYTLLCIVFLYIPLLYIGVNAMIGAVVTAIVILCATIFLLNGWAYKSKSAMIGTTLGVTIAGLLAFFVGKAAHLSGFNMEDVESLIYIADHTKLRIFDILFAGILISSLGAVMDVSVSVVAAMDELHNKAPELSAKELFLSGLHIGHDMIGTMSNTLILAYVGAATGSVLTIYSYEMTYLQTMGYNSIVIEIISGICGTIGVILTVPIQAAISAVWLSKKKS